MKTPIETSVTANRTWYLLDAQGVSLGRVARQVAFLLRGKHKPSFTRNQEMGDFVVVINSKEAKMSGKKRTDKLYYRHSGFPGGLKVETYAQLVEAKPTEPMRKAVKGMLPKGPLGNKLLSNVKIYAGSEHPHQSQNPKVFEL